MAVRMVAGLALALALAGAAGIAHGQDARPFRITLPQQPSSLDLLDTRNAPVDFPVALNYTEPLWQYDAKGLPGPWLAQSFEVSPDGKQITFHLRHGVKFQSGDDFTASDVVFSFQRQKDKQPAYARTAQNVDHVDILDAYTVRFVLKAVDVAFLANRGLYIGDKAYFDKVGEQVFTTHPVGTGPYSFVDYQIGDHIDLKRFDGYWGGKTSVPAVRFTFIKEDSSRVAALRAGETDMIADTPYPQVAALEKAGFKTARIAAYPSILIRFQFANPNTPWSDRRVREAVAHAIDMDAIARGVLHGVPQRTAWLAPGEIGYDPTLKPYAYDPALSKRLLAEAGYPKGFAMPLYYQSDSPGIPETTEAVTLYLKAVGIDADVKPLSSGVIFDTIIKAAKDPKAEYVILNTASAANNSDSSFGLSVVFDSRSPFSWYVNPAYNALIDQILAEPDIARRGDLTRTAVRILYDDVAGIDLWNTVHVFAFDKTVDFTLRPKIVGPLVQDISVH